MKLDQFLFGTVAGSFIINTTMVVADIYLFKTWQKMSNYLGIPMWVSLIISIIFIISLLQLYKKKIREIIKKNGNHKDREMQESESEI